MGYFDAGLAELKWPDQQQLNVSMASSEGGYKVPGENRRASSAVDAKRIATRYAQMHAAWGLPGSKVLVNGVGDTSKLGWMVSWRRRQGKVLLPIRLDVLVERSGRITELIARNISDPRLPPVRINESKAVAAAYAHFHKTNEREAQTILLAQQYGLRFSWRP
ncbi:hypothetical protein [Streptomyces sp. MST-110588]|uniref:hypothetical protein n=1 Tax=Streptomyces sp. MST-110588 TaxID=2833628 RepID=UPI001F5E0775|nr:hypothetical protein [Streptomyces sp. MST-110588]UNO40497.1 hypothetical protein KGS77_14080 [Streptomyces sp. MST-110588]